MGDIWGYKPGFSGVLYGLVDSSLHGRDWMIRDNVGIWIGDIDHISFQRS
jgi:hypothetical protein